MAKQPRPPLRLPTLEEIEAEDVEWEEPGCETCGGSGKTKDGKICPDCDGTGTPEPFEITFI